jgi:hypothetical protein
MANPNQQQSKPVTVNVPPQVQVTPRETENPHDVADRELAKAESLNDLPSVDAYEEEGNLRHQFQSEEARNVHLQNNNNRRRPQSEVRPAEISKRVTDREQVKVRASDESKLVMVTPREDLPRFRVGDKWYSIQNGRKTLVPKHVARMMEQKGLI